MGLHSVDIGDVKHYVSLQAEIQKNNCSEHEFPKLTYGTQYNMVKRRKSHKTYLDVKQCDGLDQVAETNSREKEPLMEKNRA